MSSKVEKKYVEPGQLTPIASLTTPKEPKKKEGDGDGGGKGSKGSSRDTTLADNVGVVIHRPWYRRLFPFLFSEEYVVLWNYEGMKPDEMTLRRGRLVWVKSERYMSGRRWRWAWIKDKVSGKEGYIPRSYIIPHSETFLRTYSGLWYLGAEDHLAVRAHMEETDLPIGTFAMCKIQKININAGDEYIILVKIRSGKEKPRKGEKLASAIVTEAVLNDERPVKTEQEDELVTASGLSGTLSGVSGRARSGANTGTVSTVGMYKVRRDANLRYCVNPGCPSPNLYSLVSRLKSRPITIPVALREALPLRPGEEERDIPIPPPPAHPTRVPMDIGPNIDAMTREEKRELLRPYGIKSADIDILEKLGEGNFGTVYRGKWKRAKQRDEVPVALKILRRKSREQEAEFREEALIMGKLDHPNIIAFFGYDEAKHVLVMELLSSGSLEGFLRRRRKKTEQVRPRDLVDMLYQVAAGMSHVESQHLVHRDLAARNCLLAVETGEGRRIIKVSDFGMAVPMSAELERRKPAEVIREWWNDEKTSYPWKWMAPESVRFKVFSHKTDVWAFGILMYEVWTLGGEPYGLGLLETKEELLEYLENGNRVETADAMPPSMRSLQAHCLRQDPDDRLLFAQIHKLLAQLLNSPEFALDVDQYIDKLPERMDDPEDSEGEISDKDFDNFN